MCKMNTLHWIGCVLAFLALPGVWTADKVAARLPVEYLQDGRMAARLSCQPEEVRHYKYASETQMWGEAGGKMTLSADLAIHCLGEDKGTYGTEALKYFVEISGITSTPSYNSSNPKSEAHSRSKRGVRDFFKSIWQRIKSFFSRVFGGGSSSTASPPTVATNPMLSDGEREDNGGKDDTDPSPSEDYEIFDPESYNRQYGTPFEFVQLANGSIPEIRFAANDTDQSSRNFKRHLTDVFATHMDRVVNSVEEVSPLGKHRTKYSHSGYRGNLNSASLVSLLTTGSSAKDNADKVKVTRRFDSSDIVNFQPITKGMNNPRDVSLDARQVQEFADGEMTSSEGRLQFSLNTFDNRRRRREVDDDGDDLVKYFQVETSFTLELRRRLRRSTEEAQNYNELEKSLKFTAHSLTATVSSDAFFENRLDNLRHKLRDNVDVVRTLMNDQDSEMMSIALEIMQLESKLGLESDKRSLINHTRKMITLEAVSKNCVGGLSSKCRDILLLLTNAGGPASEQIILKLINDAKSKESLDSVDNYLISSMSSLPKPSSTFVRSLMEHLSQATSRNDGNPALAGLLAVSLSTLVTSNSHVRTELVAKISEALLRDQSCGESDSVTATLLFVRALGIMNADKELLSTSRRCSHSSMFQEEVIRALKDSLNQEDVIRRLLELVEGAGSCHLKADVVEMLAEATAKQQQANEGNKWPLSGFNQLDELLSQRLLSGQSGCLEDIIVTYFRQKQDARAEQTLHMFTQKTGTGRRKRALLDNFFCDDWQNGNATQNEVLMDRGEEDFNRWKWCSAEQSLGRKMANAYFSGGLFAGVKYPSNPTHYKVNAKFKSEANFLGKKFNVGNVNFKVDDKSSKVNVELLGRTLLDLKGEKCSQDEFVYRPAEHIPLYVLNIWVVEVSLGLHLGVDTTLKFRCPEGGGYQIQPKAKLRVGGEATGRVLMLRGGVNVGGDFNYHIRSNLQPYPEVCFSAIRGYDPMNIGIESWFQFWKPWFVSWGGRKVWNPALLKWDLGAGNEEPWVRPYCLLAQNSSKSDSVPS